ncbi:hypothetical protein BDR04DRAFT_1063848 [Suillus decipiens]|nr:hypothetical protein BDR04DRAFT_1063848 [Suillus decipiens]
MSVTRLSGETKEKKHSQLLVLKHDQKRVMVKRQRSYNDMLNSVCKHFPSIPRDVVTLQTNQLDICDGHYVDITAEIWDDIIDSLHIVEVIASGSGGGVIKRENQCIRRSHNIGDLDSILNIRVKKPVIYVYSPSDIDVSVKLSLIPEWTLSVIYPIVTTEDHGQRLEWNVRTHQDGSLTEHNSGLEVSYLFWEAETNLQAFPRSSASKPQPVDSFNPIFSGLDDTDSIVIPVDKAAVYLDESLKVLGLHTEARTSFISFWLPYILKHEYIALRFVPQSAYERAASLSISPQPDVVIRVFMLFRGILKEHLANWSNARMQAEKDVAWWVDVVGVDVAKAGDVASFRVLEWGGMEVPI